MKNLLYLFVLLSINIFSQGQILDKVEANKLFGQVEISKEISSETLKQLTLQSFDVIMFKIINNEIYILDNHRNVLLPVSGGVSSTEVFSVYSVSIVQQLIFQGNNPVTYVQKRKDVLTITNGEYTLEYSGNCPPYCPD